MHKKLMLHSSDAGSYTSRRTRMPNFKNHNIIYDSEHGVPTIRSVPRFPRTQVRIFHIKHRLNNHQDCRSRHYIMYNILHAIIARSGRN